MPLKDLFNLSLNTSGCTDFYRKKKSVLGSLNCLTAKRTPLTPKHSRCWWLARSVTFVFFFVLCLQWPHCWCLSTPLLLWQCIIPLSMSTSRRKKQSLKKSARGQADMRSRHWALGPSLPISEFLGRKLPTLSDPFFLVHNTLWAEIFFFKSDVQFKKMHIKADHLTHKSSFEMVWENTPCRYRRIICNTLFCPLFSFTVTFNNLSISERVVACVSICTVFAYVGRVGYLFS